MNQTPQQPVPGGFLQTPAAAWYQSIPAQPLFRKASSPSRPRSSSSSRQPVHQHAQEPESKPIVRAANTINDTLQKEQSFPDLDGYVMQGISGDYDISENAAWAPYQKKAFYEIPARIHDLYNQNQASIGMGLFAELNHAWITIDNRLFMWDYTNPNPEIIGYDEETTAITAVKLVVPREGVFVDGITHVLVIATTNKILLLGVASQKDAGGITRVSIYRTELFLAIKGLAVKVIVGSAATGRIFFSCQENDIYELTYSLEERWFTTKCGKLCHTSTPFSQVVPSALWTPKSQEHVIDLVVDDTRYLLYALSNHGTIRTFHMETPQTLVCKITKTKKSLLDETSHMLSQPTPLFDENTAIISISAISGNEALKLHLMATTSSGCRLFLSATRGFAYTNSKNDAPQSMQLQHLKFPPKELGQSQQSPQNSRQFGQWQDTTSNALETQSRSLETSRLALRYAPGFFLDFVTKDGKETFFLSAPDSGRLACEAPRQVLKYYEQAIWMDLESIAQDIGLVTAPFAAGPASRGFGNELAVQFDEPAPELAVLTTTGVHVIRRRRLLDIFSTAVRQGGSYEDPEDGIQHFIKRYGHGEAAAAALAIACGQAVDNGDVGVVKVTDSLTLERARKAFIENGLKAIAQGGTDIEQVRPSSRHEGIALYASRVVRTLWKSKVIDQKVDSEGRVTVSSQISTRKLKTVQEDLAELADFLEKNKTFIHGLEGPTELARAANSEEETALKGEHRALHSLQILINDMIEGISFVQMLFDERVDQIWLSLDDPTRQQLRDLTYENLFSRDAGKALAKVLVKAIVTRNITNGLNIETVADALRRRCGSFCSTEDVITFRAQEQIKKAAEKGRDTDLGRALLNDSLSLLRSIAEHLPFDTTESIVNAYITLQFFAGATELALRVASAHDKGNKALQWVNDGLPPDDARSHLHDFRLRCYALIKDALENLDAATSTEPDGRPGSIHLKRIEAYTVVNDSEDELFHTYLYDYYLQKGWIDRLLAVDSKFITSYLEKLATTAVEYADLLWQFFSKSERYYEAGAFQLQLAKSPDFDINLDRRIEYLSFAKANAMTLTPGISRQTRQLLLHEVNNLLDVANIQDELLQRLLSDPRITSADKRAEISAQLDGPIQELTLLFNEYADQAAYYDIELLIYQAADHHSPENIRNTWAQHIDNTHRLIEDKGSDASEEPYEAITTAIRDLSHKLNSEDFFPRREIIPLVERYAFEFQRNVAPANWVPDLFISIGTPFEVIVPILEDMFYSAEAPFTGQHRMVLANHLVYVVQKWAEDCARENKPLFGGRDGAEGIVGVLGVLESKGLKGLEFDVSRDVKARVARTYGN